MPPSFGTVLAFVGGIFPTKPCPFDLTSKPFDHYPQTNFTIVREKVCKSNLESVVLQPLKGPTLRNPTGSPKRKAASEVATSEKSDGASSAPHVVPRGEDSEQVALLVYLEDQGT